MLVLDCEVSRLAFSFRWNLSFAKIRTSCFWLHVAPPDVGSAVSFLVFSAVCQSSLLYMLIFSSSLNYLPALTVVALLNTGWYPGIFKQHRESQPGQIQLTAVAGLKWHPLSPTLL